jgi:hypothetical protein
MLFLNASYDSEGHRKEGEQGTNAFVLSAEDFYFKRSPNVAVQNYMS